MTEPTGATKVAYIGLGSNLADPVQQVLTALDELRATPGMRLLAHSSLYRNAPMGPPDQPDYVNAVACVETSLLPEALLDALLAIEQRHGRVRDGERWGPRTLDLDLLLFGEDVIASERLVVPHPGMPERPFVLLPLQQIAPDLQIPGMGSLAALCARCEADAMTRIEVPA